MPKVNNIDVIAVASGKGGTGKSIICASLGYALAHSGRKTLLIDMDLFTSGLTYYALPDHYVKIQYGLRDIFLENAEISQVEPLQITNDFCSGNLYMLPSVATHRRRSSELSLAHKFNDISHFTTKVKSIIQYLEYKYEFENIIIDTRGGSDLTSIGTILAAEHVVIVTEADKPSWDMGTVLIDSIYDASHEFDIDTILVGFIINKNVLPSEAIELFLKKEWVAQHLATIPLSPDVIRYFQEDKVPIAEVIDNKFSNAIINIIYKLFEVNKWSMESKNIVAKLLEKSKEGLLAKNQIRLKKNRDISMGHWLQIYGITLAFILILFKNIILERFFRLNKSDYITAESAVEILTIISLIAIVYPSIRQVKEILRYDNENN